MSRKPGHGNNDDMTPEQKAMVEKAKAEGADIRADFHVWRCETCKDQPEFSDFRTFKNHLIAVHQVDANTAKVTKQETMHLDGTKFYQTNYACKIIGSDITYTEVIRQQRTGEDALMWMDI